MVFSLVLSLLDQFEGAVEVPDSVDTHGPPAFSVDVVEGDDGAVVEGLFLRCTLTLWHVVGRDEVGAGRASCMAERAVFLDKLKDDDAFVEGFSQIVRTHNQSLSTIGSK